MDIIRIIFAIVLPPLGVFLQVGLGKSFWINVLLTLLGYIPGIIHAIYVIVKVGPERPRIRPAYH
ncbi:MAG TPA: YqaE/Pmp3 family membrane protein [Acidobacteriota bacterium]|nr:YqaE/Pmp3 family membrane protein [Acidobacteriota bacterium]